MAHNGCVQYDSVRFADDATLYLLAVLVLLFQVEHRLSYADEGQENGDIISNVYKLS